MIIIFFSDDKTLCFSCSDNKFSLCMENYFYNGYIGKTKTYNNELLTKEENFMLLKWNYGHLNTK